MAEMLVGKENVCIDEMLDPFGIFLMLPIKASRKTIAESLSETRPAEVEEIADQLRNVKIPSDFKGVIKACEEHDVFVYGQLIEMMARRPDVIKYDKTVEKIKTFFEGIIGNHLFTAVKKAKWRHGVVPIEKHSTTFYQNVLNWPISNECYSVEHLINAIQYTDISPYDIGHVLDMNNNIRLRNMLAERKILTYGQLLKAADSDYDKLWKLVHQCDKEYYCTGMTGELSKVRCLLSIFSEEFKRFCWENIFHDDSNLETL